LKGFFWPRTKYKSDEELEITREKISSKIKQLKN
jgi:hypothetical protein